MNADVLRRLEAAEARARELERFANEMHGGTR